MLKTHILCMLERMLIYALRKERGYDERSCVNGATFTCGEVIEIPSVKFNSSQLQFNQLETHSSTANK